MNRSGAERKRNTGSNTYFIFHSLPASHHCTCAHALPQLRVASDAPLGRFRSGGRLAAIPCSLFRRTFLRLKRRLPVTTHSRSICSGIHEHPTHLLPKTKPLADINLVCNPHTHTHTRWPGLGILGRHVHTDEFAVAGLHRRVVREDAAGNPRLRGGNAQHAERPRECGGSTVSEILVLIAKRKQCAQRRGGPCEIANLLCVCVCVFYLISTRKCSPFHALIMRERGWWRTIYGWILNYL